MVSLEWPYEASWEANDLIIGDIFLLICIRGGNLG